MPTFIDIVPFLINFVPTNNLFLIFSPAGSNLFISTYLYICFWNTYGHHHWHSKKTFFISSYLDTFWKSTIYFPIGPLKAIDILGVPFQFHILVGISELLRQPVNDRVLKAAMAISHYLPLKSGQSPGCCLPPIDPENLQQWVRRRSWMILPARPMANTIGGVVYSWYCGVGWRINYWPILHMLSKYCGEEQRWRPPTTVRNQKSGPAPCTNHLRGALYPSQGGLTTYLMGESLPK